MDANALFRAGQLGAAIEALGAELRKRPNDVRSRTFLFELLCFAGDHARAAKQLDILSDASKEAAAGALVYRSALHAEEVRRQMFDGGTLPATATAEGPPGAMNGRSFATVADADPRIGAHLEAFIAGSYTWVPFRYIESVEIAPPKRLRDLLWATAVLRTTPDFRLQDLGEVLLPVLAPLSDRHPQEDVRLGRTTVWEDHPQWGAIPSGQKTLLCDGEEIAFLEVRSLVFQAEQSAAGQQGSGDHAPA